MGVGEDHVAVHLCHIPGGGLVVDCPVGELVVGQLVELPDPGVGDEQGVQLQTGGLNLKDARLGGPYAELVG